MREIKYGVIWQHGETGRMFEKKYTLDQLISGDHFDEVSDCPLMRDYAEVVKREYTGLKDKNGVEIYEGDIIRGDLYDHRIPIMGVVEYDEEYAHYASRNDAGLTPLRKIDKIMKISSIYENPELLGNV